VKWACQGSVRSFRGNRPPQCHGPDPWAAFSCAAVPSEETDIVTARQRIHNRAKTFFSWHPPLNFLHDPSINAMIYSSQHVAQGHYCITTCTQAYHGRAICAQQLGDTAGAPRWSEQDTVLTEQHRDMEFYASALITWASCLVKIGQNDAALARLRTIDSDSRFPASVAHTAVESFYYV